MPDWIHYVHPMWNPHILMFVSFKSKTKMLNIQYIWYISFKMKHFSHPIILDCWSHKVLFSGCFSINYTFLLFCPEGCSHSSVHDVSILLSSSGVCFFSSGVYCISCHHTSTIWQGIQLWEEFCLNLAYSRGWGCVIPMKVTDNYMKTELSI